MKEIQDQNKGVADYVHNQKYLKIKGNEKNHHTMYLHI
jgi:hypothetical protein